MSHEEQPRRGRERSRRRRRRLRARRGCLAALSLLIVLAVSAALLYRDATAARAELAASRVSMQEFATAVAAGEPQRAQDHLDDARAAVERADAASSGPHWRLVSQLPVVGRSPGIVQAVVGVAGASVRLAQRANELVPELLSEASEGLRVTEGAFDVARLEGVGEAIGELPLQGLDYARDQLADTRIEAVPAVLRDARRDALDLADESIRTVDATRTLLDVLPDFLGAGGERRYLLAVQSSAELRGTGGLLGYVGVLAVDDGRMRLADTGIVDPAAGEGDAEADERGDGGPAGLTELGARLEASVPTNQEFHARYGDVAADALFANVNVDPDLPTTAPVVLDLYEAYTGEELDGLVALDPVGMGMILSAIGPIEVPTEDLEDAGGLPTTVPADEVARVTTIDVYEVFGEGRSEERSRYFSALSRGAFERIFGGSWEALPVARRLAEATGGRHVQLYSRDQQEQAAFEELGVAGVLPAPEDHDLLAVTANNGVGGKQDVHVAHHLVADVTLGEVHRRAAGSVVRRTTDLRVEVENPLPSSGRDLYIIGNCLVDQGRNACFEGPPGVNRTWFTVWTVPPTLPTSVEASDGTTPPVIVDEIHGHRALDRSMETPPEDRNHFDVGLAGEVPLHREGDALVYELLLWRQAKAIPDHWDVTVAAPEGWSVAEVEIHGGGDGQGMGVGGDGRPLRSSVAGDSVSVEGAVTQDARIVVRFARPWTDRLRVWLGEPAF